MALVQYYGNVSYRTTALFDVYDGKKELRDLWQIVKSNISDEMIYTETIERKIDGEKIAETVEYKWRIRELSDECFRGFLYKNAYVHYKEMDEELGHPVGRKVKTNEAINFYYEPACEMVAYNRTQRFGYVDGLNAFCHLLSLAYTKQKRSDLVDGTPYTSGYNWDGLKQGLKNEKLSRLGVIYSIPNPNDELLSEIRKDPEKMISAYKDANITSKNVTYFTDASDGLKVSSLLIETELEEIEKIHSHLSAEEALKKGYVEITTTDIHGVTRTSKDVSPLTLYIADDDKFDEEARRMIHQIVRDEMGDE